MSESIESDVVIRNNVILEFPPTAWDLFARDHPWLASAAQPFIELAEPRNAPLVVAWALVVLCAFLIDRARQ